MFNRMGWLAVVIFAVTSVASAAGPYDERTVRGIWTLAVEGYVAPGGEIATLLGAPAGTPLFAVATVTFDGAGNCRSTDQIVLGGQFIPSPTEFRQAVACTYSVAPDGIGTFAVTFPALGLLSETTTLVTFVLSDRRNLDFIASNAVLGIYGGGKMRRQIPQSR